MFLLWLAGCATPVPDSNTLGQSEFLRYGRFALKTEDFNRNPEALQGGFTWRDTGERFSLDLTDPMGSVIARVVVERAGATLTRANGEQTYAKTPDALMQTVLGQTVPVDGLRSWLRTITTPLTGMSMVLKDPEGRIQTFEQSGWRVQLSRFDELGPQLLVLTKSEGSKNIAIRLVVDKP
jgi:outer membrane lipoprotein LolB